VGPYEPKPPWDRDARTLQTVACRMTDAIGPSREDGAVRARKAASSYEPILRRSSPEAAWESGPIVQKRSHVTERVQTTDRTDPT
jgi:hypothetical protein